MYKLINLKKILIGLILLNLVSYGSAQTRPEGRPVSILYYKAPAVAPEKAFIYGSKEKEVIETPLPRYYFSETFYIRKGLQKLSFLPGLLEEGEEVPSGAPSVTIPEDWKKVLLLVFNNQENSIMPIRVKAINASDNVFGNGSIYIANLTELALIGTLGDKEIKMAPKSTKVVKGLNGFYPAKIDYIVRGSSSPLRFIRQTWKQTNNKRNILLVLPQDPPSRATYYSSIVNLE